MELGWRFRRQRQRSDRSWKVLRQPIDGRFEVQVVQVDHQVDGAATAAAAVPVHELGAVDREHSLSGMPFVFVVLIPLAAAQRQDRFQGNGPELIGLLPPLPLARYAQVGNAAGVGVARMLASTVERERAAAIAARCRYVELNTHPQFQKRFMNNIGFAEDASAQGDEP